jgi:hypothetical protein
MIEKNKYVSKTELTKNVCMECGKHLIRRPFHSMELRDHLITSKGLYIIIIIRIMNYYVSSNGNGLLYSNGLGIIIIIRTMYYYVSLNGNGLLLSNGDYFIISNGLGIIITIRVMYYYVLSHGNGLLLSNEDNLIWALIS